MSGGAVPGIPGYVAPMTRSEFIDAYLATGEVDPDWAPWGGDAVAGAASLVRVLDRIVAYRAGGAPLARRKPPASPHKALLKRVNALIDGLLAPDEAAALRAALPERVRVVTVANLTTHLSALPVDDAWALTNIVLEDMGAPPLSDGAPQLDGLCTAGQIWIPPGAFTRPTERIDVLVHEVAHLIHSLDRSALGLPGEGALIAVPDDQHETFAYACELWVCQLRVGATPAQLQTLARDVGLEDSRVDSARLSEALVAASQQGWPGLLGVIRGPQTAG